MNNIVFAILGGLIGWVLTVLTPAPQRLHIGVGVMIGIAGALLGRWLLALFFQASSVSENGIATTTALVSTLGAALFFGLVSLARHRIGH